MLERLRRLEKPLRIGIIGMGSMGKGLFHQTGITPGIRCVAIADIRLERAIACAETTDREFQVVQGLDAMHDAIRAGKVAVCEDGGLISRCELLDAVVEASNSIVPAARFAIAALEHRKHLILMNSEIDLAFGPHLMRLAGENGVVYSSCGGDQHGVITGLIDEIRLWGFELILAGNIKGFLDRRSNPLSIVPEADKRRLGYRMATAYTDGTKLNVEMALLANACDLSVTVPGMRGPPAEHVREALHLFDLDAIRKSGKPVADYLLGAEPHGGVFAIGHCDHPYQRSMLSYYKMGEGPFYVFYRPYHLCHVEAMSGIALACLEGQSLLQPLHGFRTNVYAYAKKDLRKGEVLDGMGGHTCYGLIEGAGEGGGNPGLPVMLAENVKLGRDIPADGRIGMEDVVFDPERFDFALFSRAVAEAKAGR